MSWVTVKLFLLVDEILDIPMKWNRKMGVLVFLGDYNGLVVHPFTRPKALPSGSLNKEAPRKLPLEHSLKLSGSCYSRSNKYF